MSSITKQMFQTMFHADGRNMPKQSACDSPVTVLRKHNPKHKQRNLLMLEPPAQAANPRGRKRHAGHGRGSSTRGRLSWRGRRGVHVVETGEGMAMRAVEEGRGGDAFS